MTLEHLYNQLHSITYLIGEATTDAERIILEQQYSQEIADILEQIEQIEDGTA
jgi:ubiquinone biosynthesis protein UbiJ